MTYVVGDPIPEDYLRADWANRNQERLAALERESAALQAALDWLGSLPEVDVAPSYVWTEMMRRLGRLST